MSRAGVMQPESRTDSEAMDALWRGVHLKEDAAASGSAGLLHDAVGALASIEDRFPEERAVIAKSLLQLSDCFELAGDTERARDALVRVAQEFSHADREAAGLAMLGLSRIAAHGGRSLAEVGELWSQSVETLTDPQQRAHAWIWHAQTLLQHGDAAGCRKRLGSMMDDLSPERDPSLFFWAHDLIGISYIIEGDRHRAERVVHELKQTLSSRIPEEILSNSITEALLRRDLSPDCGSPAVP